MRAVSRLAFAVLTVVVLLPGAAIAAGAAGGAAIAAGAAHATPGAFVWTRTLDVSLGSDDLLFCDRGNAGAVYACGTRGWPTTDIWLVKYTSSGTLSWSRTWSGPGGLDDVPRGMEADARGNVYVCGSTARTSDAADSVLLKYDAAGTLKWATIYDPEGLDDAAEAIGLDAAGDAYVAGWSSKPAASSAVYTAKFAASDGARQWTSWYDGPGDEHAAGVAVTGAGACYVVGDSAADGGRRDALLVRTSASGGQAWVRTWNGPRNGNDEWATVALAPAGDVIVAGTEDYSHGGDMVAARYSSAGKRVWLGSWSSGRYLDQAEDLAVASDGSVWVGSTIDREEGDVRTALVKWSATGTRLFARTIGSRRTAAELHGVTVDGCGNAYVAGAIIRIGRDAGWDMLVAKYGRGGDRRWLSTAGFRGDSQEMLYDVVLGSPGFLYACGTAGWEGIHSRGAVVKLRR
jgi:hypothetical protein